MNLKYQGLESTRMVKNIRNGMRVETQVSFSSLDSVMRNLNKAYQSDLAHMEQQFSEYDNRYAKKVAGEMKLADKSKFKDKVNRDKEKLYAKIEEIYDSKVAYMDQYFTAVPPEELVRYIQLLGMRESISKTEWEMALKRVTESGNYLALVMLNDNVAKKFGYDFSVPDNPETYREKLEETKNIYLSVVDNIEKPAKEWTYMMFAILSDNDNTVKQAIAEQDTTYGMSVPDPDLTTIGRLKASAQNALHAGDVDLFTKIYAFIADNRNKLETEQEREQAFILEVENLIEAGNNAKEDNRPDFVKQRDKVIQQLEEMTGEKKDSE